MPPDFNPNSASPLRFAGVPGNPRCSSLERDSVARAIASALELITKLRADAGLVALLAADDPEEGSLETGEVLAIAAEEQLERCEKGVAEFEILAVERDEAWIDAREQYLEFREWARSVCMEISWERKLHITAKVRRALPEFVVQAGASYRAARKWLVAPGRKRGVFDGSRILRALEELRNLKELDRRVARARRACERSRDEREIAVGMLNFWVRALLRQIRRKLGRTRHPPARGAGDGGSQSITAQVRRRMRALAPRQRRVRGS